MKYFLKKKGFTLIELLVVIAIIGILTAIITANFTQAKQKARDTKRVLDIAQIQGALEMLFDKCNKYPSIVQYRAFTGVPAEVCNKFGVSYTLNYFISKMPTPPTTGEVYDYAVTGTFDNYVLRAKLETNSSSLTDDLDGSPLSTDCDDTSPKYYYCVSPL